MLRNREVPWPLLTVLAAVLLAAPLWCVAMPGMPDYPAHLASFALIAGEPSRYYAIQWAALPNLASEVLVPLLGRLMSLEDAARLFLTVTVALWVLGPALIQRALFGRIGPGILLSAPFAYNANFIWGFFNYSFSVGLAFLVFAAWIATERRRAAAHLPGFAAAFTLVYFSHIVGFAVLLLAIGGFELQALIDERFAVRALARRVLVPALLCLPAALAFTVFKPAGAADGRFAFDLLETLQDRFEAAVQFGFDRPALIVVVAMIVLFAAAAWSGRATVHPRMRIVLALFALAALFAPEWALGGWGVHMRLPAVLGALAFASLEWRLAPRAKAIGAAATLVLLAVCAGLVASDWRIYDARYAEFRAHAAAVKPGGKILVALDGDSLGWTADQPYWHLAEFAIIDRGAFTPLMFTTAGQHVVHIRPPLERIAAATAQQGSPPDIDELADLAAGRMDADEDYADVYPYLRHFQCHFDQVIAIEGPGPHAPVPPLLRLRASGSFYRLYDVVPTKDCSGR
ncbi:MAG TPA: hypothetical protein VGB91_01530 [Rhizomicrobium sp.]